VCVSLCLSLSLALSHSPLVDSPSSSSSLPSLSLVGSLSQSTPALPGSVNSTLSSHLTSGSSQSFSVSSPTLSPHLHHRNLSPEKSTTRVSRYQDRIYYEWNKNGQKLRIYEEPEVGTEEIQHAIDFQKYLPSESHHR
jgi:hypothetical protein